MGQGLQVWNETGRMVFDSSTRTMLFIANVEMSGNQTKTIYHPMFAVETPFYIVRPLIILSASINIKVSFNFTACTISSTGADSNQNFNVIIGVY